MRTGTWKPGDSVLLRHAYLYDSAEGRLLPRDHCKVRLELLEVFGELVKAAAEYKKLTGRHLPILGELGELFVGIMFGIKRHNPMTQGSDGLLTNDFVEVKTIAPDKRNDGVRLKRAGNFGKLVVVKYLTIFSLPHGWLTVDYSGKAGASEPRFPGTQ